MKKILLPFLLCVCGASLANQPLTLQDCKPTLTKQTLTYQPTTNTPVNFAGLVIELPPPKAIGLFGDSTVFKYDQDKAIYLTDSTAMLSENRADDYDPAAVYKEAFGLQPKQAENKDEIVAIKRLQRLCVNRLIQYQIKGVDEVIIRTTGQNNANSNIVDTFILAPSTYVYMIGFKGFTNQEIDQLLATIHQPIRQ